MTELKPAKSRIADLVRFYEILADLAYKVGTSRKLYDCSGRMIWPKRGVYFFFEGGENRSDTGDGPRVIRVGTHALSVGSRTQLWSRLSQHKGQRNGGAIIVAQFSDCLWERPSTPTSLSSRSTVARASAHGSTKGYHLNILTISWPHFAHSKVR